MPEIRSSDGSVRPGTTVSPGELPALGLDGVDLVFIRIDYQTRLQFGTTEVVIGTPFSLATDDGDQTLDPADRAGLGPLLSVYPAALASAVVETDLTLHLTFASGTRIEVPQDSHYEAWQVAGPGSRLIVCPPEGDRTLSYWR